MNGEQLADPGRLSGIRELDRRHLATSAFLGVGPFHSCDGPASPRLKRQPVLENPTADDKEYSDAVKAIILGKEA